MLNEKTPPTHTAWTQYRERGKFREWYKSGHAWIETDKDGQITGQSFQAMNPRAHDGFTYFFPVGIVPPDPTDDEEPKRPGNE